MCYTLTYVAKIIQNVLRDYCRYEHKARMYMYIYKHISLLKINLKKLTLTIGQMSKC